MDNYLYKNALHNAAHNCDVLNKSFREYEYLSKVDAAGGFKKYEKAHLATLTKTFVPKFTMLPKELVRHVVSVWLHAGYY